MCVRFSRSFRVSTSQDLNLIGDYVCNNISSIFLDDVLLTDDDLQEFNNGVDYAIDRLNKIRSFVYSEFYR